MGSQPCTNGDLYVEPACPGQIQSSLPTVPITVLQKPFVDSNVPPKLPHAGTTRANLAPSLQSPHGSSSYASQHSHQTVLQQHISFFDPDADGIIWPQDTYFGFRALGFSIPLSLFSVFIIHLNFSYPTLPTWLPDPLFRIHLSGIHHDKHGSDTNTYDHEGRFSPQHFENIFAKYAEGRDYLTWRDVARVWNGQRCVGDPFGWGAAIFEWLATWILLWPEDGRMMKEDIRGVYDGSIFYRIAERKKGTGERKVIVKKIA